MATGIFLLGLFPTENYVVHVAQSLKTLVMLYRSDTQFLASCKFLFQATNSLYYWNITIIIFILKFCYY